MKEYIELNNINEEYGSWLYIDFINKREGLKVDIDHLRNIYLESKESFLLLVQELSLRGCKFVLEKPNNLLSSIHIAENTRYIYIKENRNLFRNIDFNKFNLGDILSKYNIVSDLFFNMIPIDGFRVFNNSIDTLELADEFLNAGYDLISPKAKENIYEDTGKKNNDNDLMKKKLEKVKKNEYEYIDTNNFKAHAGIENKEIDYSKIEEFGDILIENAFSENSFVKFREFTTNICISLLKEINNEVINQYALYPKVGAKRVYAIKERLLDIINQNYICKDIKVFFLNRIEKEDDIEISKLFIQKKYKSFVDYCNQNNLTMISEIDNDLLDKASRIFGFGKTKLEMVNNILYEYIENISKRKISEETKIIEIPDKWLCFLENSDISKVAEILDISWDNREKFKVNDIKGKTLLELEVEYNKKNIIDIVNKLSYTKTIEELLTDVRDHSNRKESITERELRCIKFRVSKGYTLEQIGQYYNITRERVRQIIEFGIHKIEKILDSNNINTSINLTFFNKSFCTVEEFFDIAGEENNVLVRALLKSKEVKLFSAENSLGIMHFNNSIDLKIIDDFIQELPDRFKFYDYLDDIIEMLNSLGIDDIEMDNIDRLLISNGFNHYCNYYSRNKMNFVDIFEIVFKDYIIHPLYLDEDGYNLIVKICKEYLNFEFESSAKAVCGRIRDIENIVLVDGKTYQHIDNLSYDKNVIPIIKQYLDQELKLNTTISAQLVMKKYEKELSSYGVKNKYILYSLVSKYLEQYKIGRGNTLEISMSLEELKKTSEDVLIELIDNNYGRIKISEVIKLTSWVQFKIENTICKSKIVLKIGEYITSINYLGLNDTVRKTIETVVCKEMDINGFTTTSKLFDKLIVQPDVYDFLKKNNVDKAEKIGSIIKFVVPETNGNIRFLYKKDSKYKRFEEVIYDKFLDICNINEVKDFIYSYGYKGLSCIGFINNMISSKMYIKISDNELIPASKFELDNSILEKLVEFIEEKFGDKEYLSLNTLAGYKRKLPSIVYSWNMYLIESILTNNGYNRVERTIYDIKTERIILVRENSKISKFDELVYMILKTEYTGNMHEIKIYEFLANLGIIYFNSKLVDKKLPFDLYVSNKFKIDEYGKVELL